MKIVWLSLSLICLLAAPAAAGPECRCKANGQEYEIGQLACLHLPNGNRLARCSMVLNNSSWSQTDDACPISMTDHHILMSYPHVLASMSTSVAGLDLTHTGSTIVDSTEDY